MSDDPIVALKEELAHKTRGYEAQIQRNEVLANTVTRLSSELSQCQAENAGLQLNFYGFKPRLTP